MKIIPLKEFLLLPAGTVYCKYFTEKGFSHLAIKHDSVHERDFSRLRNWLTALNVMVVMNGLI